MELDDLKAIWKEANVRHESDQLIHAKEIKALIHQKSNTTIAQVKRAMRFKIIMLCFAVTIAFIIGIIHAFPFFDPTFILEAYLSKMEISIMFFVLSLITLGLAISHFGSYKRIVQFEKSASSLKTTIINILDILKRVTKLAIYSDVFVTPLVAGYVVYAILLKEDSFTLGTHLGIVIMTASIMVVFSYFSNKWAMKRKFGNQIKQLKEHLSELEALENKNE